MLLPLGLWLLLGARKDTKLERAAADDLAFLDLKKNPPLAKVMEKAETANPFRHLVGGWYDRQGDKAPDEVKRLAKQFLDGWR